MNLFENRPFPHMMYRIAYLFKGATDIVKCIDVRDDRLPETTDYLANCLRCEILRIDCLGSEKENKI